MARPDRRSPAQATQPAGRVAARAAPPRQSRAPGEVRIIGGLYKRSKLSVPERPGLRPTPGRVRETLFNWLGQDLRGLRCIDVFAGSGALGFEAASRGAVDVLLVEQDAQLARLLDAARLRLQAGTVRVERGDGLAVLARLPAAAIDLVFLDPPFDAGLFNAALRAAGRVLAPGGRIYLEAPEPPDAAVLAACGLALQRSGRAGAVHYSLLGAAGLVAGA